MARPERPLDPQDGPIQAFAVELRKARAEAGNPTYLKMARQTGRSRTALGEAAGGDHLATWDTVDAYLTAVGQDPQAWRSRWEAVRQHLDATREPTLIPAGGGPQEANRPGQLKVMEELEQPDPSKKPKSRWPWLVLGAAVAVAVFGSAALLLESAPPARSAVPSAIVYVTVQNKVASGATGFYEDVTPEYLANSPVPRCAEKPGCEIPDTHMASGAVLEAICQEPGASITNADTRSAGIAQNPNAVTSTLWYRVEMPNGVQGLISEAYVTPASRGGLGLPRCSS